MNTPNPLVPQGSSLEQKRNPRSRVKIAVFFVLTIHVVGLIALLVQGCRRDEKTDQTLAPPEVPQIEPIAVPPVDTNLGPLTATQEVPPAVAPAEQGYTAPPMGETPLPVAPALTKPAAASQEYAIKRGDTFYSIGKQFGVSMQAIKEANPTVEPTHLQVGQKIVIPAPTPAADAPVAAPSGSGETVYTVASGDTLSKIAAKYGTTWQAIQQLNNLPTTSIKVGQKLKIPAPKAPATGTSGGGM